MQKYAFIYTLNNYAKYAAHFTFDLIIVKKTWTCIIRTSIEKYVFP